MKRSIIAAVAIASICAMPMSASAQGLGILGGYSFASAPNGATPGNLSAHSGFAVGLALEGSSPISFGINGLYAQRGFTSTSSGQSQRYNYIDVPAYLKLSLPNPVITPFGFVGPQASFELNCDGAGGECPTGRPKVTYSGVIGAGLKFGMLAGLSVQGRYVYGLSNLNLSTVSNSGNYQQRSFMLLLGFGF